MEKTVFHNQLHMGTLYLQTSLHLSTSYLQTSLHLSTLYLQTRLHMSTLYLQTSLHLSTLYLQTSLRLSTLYLETSLHLNTLYLQTRLHLCSRRLDFFFGSGTPLLWKRVKKQAYFTASAPIVSAVKCKFLPLLQKAKNVYFQRVTLLKCVLS